MFSFRKLILVLNLFGWPWEFIILVKTKKFCHEEFAKFSSRWTFFLCFIWLPSLHILFFQARKPWKSQENPRNGNKNLIMRWNEIISYNYVSPCIKQWIYCSLNWSCSSSSLRFNFIWLKKSTTIKPRTNNK